MSRYLRVLEEILVQDAPRKKVGHSPKSYSSENAVMLGSASAGWVGRISYFMDSLGFAPSADPSSP